MHWVFIVLASAKSWSNFDLNFFSFFF
jgi:hypothetical protein